MKRLLIPILLITFIASAFHLTGQVEPVQGNKSDLCKKWRIDFEAFIDQLPEEMKAMMDMLPPEQKAQFEAQMSAMKEAYIVFKSDGTMQARMEMSIEGEEIGTWEFTDNKTAIVTTMESDDKVTTLDILEMNSGRLTLRERGKPEDPSISFLPY